MAVDDSLHCVTMGRTCGFWCDNWVVIDVAAHCSRTLGHLDCPATSGVDLIGGFDEVRARIGSFGDIGGDIGGMWFIDLIDILSKD
jgi:hypothetical protein